MSESRDMCRSRGFRLQPEVYRRLAVAAVVLVFATACTVISDPVPQNSACRNLSYGDEGPTRAVYLPCAGEMVRLLETLDALSISVLNGEAAKRAEGRDKLRRINALVRLAGGRKLREQWKDRALTDLNLDIRNAINHYQRIYTLPIQKALHPLTAKTAEAATAQALEAAQHYRSALLTYRTLGGR